MKLPNKLTVNTFKLFITLLIIFKWSVSFSSCPYFTPVINTAESYSNIVYIDPTVNSGGDGSISSPLKAVPATLQENTAFLIKRGTTLNQSINRVFKNVLLGAYGEGNMPIVKTYGERALFVQEGSHYSTIRDIHFEASGTSPYGNSIASVDGHAGQYELLTNITVAFCRFIGSNDVTGHYPRTGFGWAGNDIVIFNNEFSGSRANFSGSSGNNHIVVRNWWHNACLASVPPDDTGTGDLVQMTYAYNAPIINAYWAGNRMDASNKTDKFALMMNFSNDSPLAQYFTFEYNTVFPPLVGRGGTGVRWAVGQYGIGRKNLVASISPNGTQLVPNFSYWEYTLNYNEPYGVRDNHLIQTNGQPLIGEGVGNLEIHNLRFNSWADYNTYLNINPEIGQYGSDINPATFLTENDTFCGGGTIPETHHTLIINIQGNGTVVKNPDKEEYNHNEEVVLTAIENSGSIFTGWAGVLENTNPVTVLMNTNKTITASFEEILVEPDPFVIQSATGAGIVTLPNTVTGGNLLVAVLAHRHDPNDQPNIPSGFTIREIIQHKTGSPDRHGILIADKIADGNETSFNLNFGTGSDLGGIILEFDLQDVTFYDANSNTSENNIPASFTENVPQPNAPHLSVSAVVSRNGEPLTEWNNEFVSPLATRNQIGVASRFDGNLNKPENVTVENTGDQGAIIVASWVIGGGGGSGQTYQINTSTTGNGSVTLNPNKLQYNENESVQLTAVPNSGWEFVEWSGDLTGPSNPATVIMSSDKDISASFQAISYQIIAQANPVNGGQISGTGIFSHGQNVTLTATTAAGYTFTNWTENGSIVSNNASYTFMVTQSRNLTANFSTNAYTIGLNSNPAAGGTTSGGGSFNHGQSATVSASPASGYTFTNWTENGGIVSNNASYTFTVTQSRNLTANFSTNAYTISLNSNPAAGGTTSGGGSFNHGQSATVSASPASGYIFTNWTENGSVVSNNTSYTFTVTQSRNLTANFSTNVYNISLNASPANGGTTNGGGNFSHGQIVTVTATPEQGYVFINWTENGNAVSSSSSYTFTTTQNITLTANFVLEMFALIYLTDSNGEIIGNPEQEVFYGANGEPVHAVPHEGHHFVRWCDQLSFNPRTEIFVTQNITRTAIFAKNIYHLSYGADKNGFVLGETDQFIEYGENALPVEAIPLSGFEFIGWSDGNNANPRTDLGVTSDLQVFAMFDFEMSLEEPDHQNIMVYPIPTKNVLNVDVLLPDKFDVYIVNNQGRLIRNLPRANQGSNSYNVSWLSPGVYYINLVSSSGRITRKFIKQQ